MNIFAIDHDPEQSARWNMDCHCVKICIEIAQMGCIPFHLNNYKNIPYKLSKQHLNHPVSLWVRESVQNFEWAIIHGLVLCDEYTMRYHPETKKKHKSQEVLQWLLDNYADIDFPNYDLTPFAQAMPEVYQNKNGVEAYRSFYINGKKHLAKWKRNKPFWYRDANEQSEDQIEELKSAS